MPLGRLPSLGCAVLIAALGQTSLPAHAQSLVDVARLVRDIRERHGPPTKVYTNEDLPDTGRITGPTRSWASRSRSLREAACERERARIALRCERPVTQPAPVPVKTVPVDPAPTPATSGIPLSLVYSFVASPHSQRPRPSTTASKSPRRHQRGSRARDRRSRLQTTGRRTTSGKRIEPSTRRPAARNGYEQSSRPFPYIAPGLPAPGVDLTGTGGRASGATGTLWAPTRFEGLKARVPTP